MRSSRPDRLTQMECALVNIQSRWTFSVVWMIGVVTHSAVLGNNIRHRGKRSVRQKCKSYNACPKCTVPYLCGDSRAMSHQYVEVSPAHMATFTQDASAVKRFGACTYSPRPPCPLRKIVVLSSLFLRPRHGGLVAVAFGG